MATAGPSAPQRGSLSLCEWDGTALHFAAMGGLTALAIRLYEEFQGQPEGKTHDTDPNGSERTPKMCAAKQFNVAAWRSHRAGNHAGYDHSKL